MLFEMFETVLSKPLIVTPYGHSKMTLPRYGAGGYPQSVTVTVFGNFFVFRSEK